MQYWAWAPYEAKVGPNGRHVQVVSRGGYLTEARDTGRDDGVCFVLNHQVDDSSLAVVGFYRSSDDPLRGRVAVFNISDMEQPLWASDDLCVPDELVPALAGLSDETTRRALWPKCAVITDVHPRDGLELIVAHNSAELSPSAIRVYTFSGEVLSEVWNDGQFSRIYWHDEWDLLVATTVNADGTWAERGIELDAGASIHPLVVCAIDREALAVGGILRWPGNESFGDLSPRWYRCIHPPEISRQVFFAYDQRHLKPVEDVAGDALWLYLMPAPDIAKINPWVRIAVNRHGDLLPGTFLCSSGWHGYGPDLQQDDLYLAELPPRVVPRREPAQ